MQGVGIILQIVLGGLAGWIAERVMRSDMGLIMNIVLGIVGALVLNFILRLVGVVPPDRLIAQFIIAIIGACALIWVGRLLRGNRSV